MFVEYKVRPVTRYLVTRYMSEGDGAGSSSIQGEFDSEHVAYEVGYALCRAEHDRLGYPVGDERIQYPEKPVLARAPKQLDPTDQD
ncbi:hypothetical protein FHW84_002489 [Dyella sp. SG562]|uniref:hypothetical protein n=1 Tax=Dyella sp. SG562 TaxID=2587017 RepID=UPI0014230D75|nr:hypothetical protein [Dyella sp. SG562]NII73916.1 hypothetical protein [Dyella sp. SG562]